jgi:phage protein D
MNIAELELKYQNFYVPASRVTVDGQDLLQAGVEVASLSVDNTLQGGDRFSFTVNNAFDAIARELRWPDLFAYGKRVEISMGYAGSLTLMHMGLITAVRVDFPAGGLPSLDVSGYDLSCQMTRGRKSRSWDNVKDSDVARAIAGDANLNPTVENTRVTHDRVVQNQETDFELLTRLARQNYYEFFVFGKTLNFRAPAKAAAPVIELEWGKGLLSFSPELNLAGQLSQVEVRGWNPGAKREIVGTAGVGDEAGRGRGRSGGELAQDQDGETVVEHVCRPVFSQAEADQSARAILNQRAEGLIRGRGETAGIPELLAGKTIMIRGLGKRFSKTYYIESTRHSIGGSGYRTTFNVKENSI